MHPHKHCVLFYLYNKLKIYIAYYTSIKNKPLPIYSTISKQTTIFMVFWIKVFVIFSFNFFLLFCADVKNNQNVFSNPS